MTDAGVSAPSMSVVLVTDGPDSIREVVGCLRAQTIADELEVVVVSPAAGGSFRLPDAPFAAVKNVPVTAGAPLEDGRAAGVLASSAPVVFIGETHSFPGPELAAALVAAHRNGTAAVVPALGNANPGVISWANLILDYGPWVAPRSAAEIERFPETNCSYRRSVLAAYGPRLREILAGRGVLAGELRATGHRGAIEPHARLDHLNVATLRAWLPERYLAGRILGGSRAARFTRTRRLAYVAGIAAVPVLHLARSLRVLFRLERPLAKLPALGPALLLGSLAWTAGELVGYVRGVGSASERMVEYELHKARYALRGPS